MRERGQDQLTRPHRFTLLLLIALLFIGLTSYGLFRLYAQQPKIPSGTTIAGMQIGGMHIGDAMKQINENLLAMEQEKIIFTYSKGQVELNWAQIGVHFQTMTFQAELHALTEGSLWSRANARWHFNKKWEIDVLWNKPALVKVLSPDWEKRQFGDTVDAQRIITDDDQIRYIPERSANRIQWYPLYSTIRDHIPSQINEKEQQQSAPIQINIPLQSTLPTITLEHLKSEGIERKIVQVSTGLQNSKSGRVHNVAATSQIINDMILKPGDIFDYNDVVEKAEKVHGFQEAPVIVRGKLIPGVGGGICQVSSTLYNAAVRAGLEIVERRHHSLPVNYLPIGQDATFAKGYINFRFKNTSGKYLLIKATINNAQLTIKLFGYMPRDTTYSIESHTSKVLTIPNKFVKNSTIPLGSQELIQSGRNGYVVETYRIKYQDGVAIEKVRLSKDTYQAQPNIYAVNSHHFIDSPSRESSPDPIIEDGVQSKGLGATRP